MTPTEIAYAHTPEWWAARRTGIGASRAAAACGLSQYGTPLEVYLELRGEAPEREETAEMRFGTIIEPAIVELYQQQHGVQLQYPLRMLRHPEHDFMLATPDAELTPEVGIELKSLSPHRAKQFDESGLANVAPDYVCQAQQQMAVTGWQCVFLVALVERRLMRWEIKRNDRLIGLMIEREAELWDRVQRAEPPEFDPCHPKALEFIRALHPDITPGVVKLPDELVALQAEYTDLSKQIRDMQARQQEIRARQLAEIGSHEGGLLPDGKYLRRSIQQRKEYTVAASERVDVRVVKLPASAEIIDPVDWSPQYEIAELALREAGFLRHDKSESGSRYYIDDSGNRVRVSDHAPNEATAAWMLRSNCRDLRVQDMTDNRAAREALALAATEGE